MTDEDSLRLPGICSDHVQLCQDVALIKQEMQQNNAMTEKILVAVEGNGGPGLKTQAELNKAGIKEQSRMHLTAMGRIWAWITLISAAIIVMAGFAIRGMLLK